MCMSGKPCDCGHTVAEHDVQFIAGGMRPQPKTKPRACKAEGCNCHDFKTWTDPGPVDIGPDIDNLDP